MNKLTFFKSKFFFLQAVFLLSLFFSCDYVDNNLLEPSQSGIRFVTVNDTNTEFQNSNIIIGGINLEGDFIETDTFKISEIQKGTQQLLDGFDDKRWKPDFDKIKSIGDGKAYFKFKLENQEAYFIKYVNNPDINLYIDLHVHKVVDDNGVLRLYLDNDWDINKDNLTAYNSAMALSQIED